MAPLWSSLLGSGERRRTDAGLFPLPCAFDPRRHGAKREGLSLSTHERRAVAREREHCVHALNWMAGCPTRSSRGDTAATVEKIGRVQERMLCRIAEGVDERRPCAECPSEEAALKELLRGRGSGYTGAASAAMNLAPFQSGLVSLPAEVSGSPPLDTLLPPGAKHYLMGFEDRMLRSAEEVTRLNELHGRVRVHVDRKLSGSRRLYRGFVKQLLKSGVFSLTRDCLCLVGFSSS